MRETDDPDTLLLRLWCEWDVCEKGGVLWIISVQADEVVTPRRLPAGCRGSHHSLIVDDFQLINRFPAIRPRLGSGIFFSISETLNVLRRYP